MAIAFDASVVMGDCECGERIKNKQTSSRRDIARRSFRIASKNDLLYGTARQNTQRAALICYHVKVFICGAVRLAKKSTLQSCTMNECNKNDETKR